MERGHLPYLGSLYTFTFHAATSSPNVHAVSDTIMEEQETQHGTLHVFHKQRSPTDWIRYGMIVFSEIVPSVRFLTLGLFTWSPHSVSIILRKYWWSKISKRQTSRAFKLHVSQPQCGTVHSTPQPKQNIKSVPQELLFNVRCANVGCTSTQFYYPATILRHVPAHENQVVNNC